MRNFRYIWLRPFLAHDDDDDDDVCRRLNKPQVETLQNKKKYFTQLKSVFVCTCFGRHNPFLSLDIAWRIFPKQ